MPLLQLSSGSWGGMAPAKRRAKGSTAAMATAITTRSQPCSSGSGSPPSRRDQLRSSWPWPRQMPSRVLPQAPRPIREIRRDIGAPAPVALAIMRHT